MSEALINKIANTIEMSFAIPESERSAAREACESFSRVMTALDTAKRHLNIIYEPFKEADSIPSEAIYEYRGAVFLYKQQIKENFNKAKVAAFHAITGLQYFSTDTHVMELINSFRDSWGDLEKQVHILLDILDNLKSDRLKDNVIQGVEAVRSVAFEIEKLIKERVLDYIDANILAKDWMTTTKDRLKADIKEKVPYVTQLFQERQRALQDIGK